MLALTLSALPTLAGAAELVVGVVHDTDGFAVAGARVTLLQAGGAATGEGTTAADGTFAVDAGAAAVGVRVQCAYCLGVTVSRAPGLPVVAVVQRFAALRDRGISAADARVLPYASAADLASLMPFTVTTYGSISDRGLAGARGTVVADGIALYRAIDGIDLGTLVPAHATAAISATDPTSANAYDASSAGGLYAIDTLDQSSGLARIDAADQDSVVLRAGNVVRGSFATAGGDEAATRGVLAGSVAAGDGSLDLRAVNATGLGASAAGFATTFTLPVRASALTTSVNLTRSVDLNGPENDAVAALSLRSGEFTYGVRGQRTSGRLAFRPAFQFDARAYAEWLHDDGRTRLFASLAAAQSGEAYAQRAAAAGAVLPILSVSTHVAPQFAVHADSVDALLSTPLYLIYAVPYGTIVNRSHLTDAGIGFDDGNRIRIDAMAFRQSVTGPFYGTTGGSGISVIWQIAPSLTLRTWSLISRDNGDNYIGGVYATGMGTLDRNSTWMTAGNVLRVDAIWRSGYLEGAISVPAGAHLRFVAGTYRDETGRTVTAGISWP